MLFRIRAKLSITKIRWDHAGNARMIDNAILEEETMKPITDRRLLKAYGEVFDDDDSDDGFVDELRKLADAKSVAAACDVIAWWDLDEQFGYGTTRKKVREFRKKIGRLEPEEYGEWQCRGCDGRHKTKFIVDACMIHEIQTLRKMVDGK